MIAKARAPVHAEVSSAHPGRFAEAPPHARARLGRCRLSPSRTVQESRRGSAPVSLLGLVVPARLEPTDTSTRGLHRCCCARVIGAPASLGWASFLHNRRATIWQATKAMSDRVIRNALSRTGYGKCVRSGKHPGREPVPRQGGAPVQATEAILIDRTAAHFRVPQN